jgi:hypothetical protein
VLLRPVPPRAQTPAVDNVADQIDRVRLDMTEHIEDEMGLAAARSQVQIREKQRPIAMGFVSLGQCSLLARGRMNKKSLRRFSCRFDDAKRPKRL